MRFSTPRLGAVPCLVLNAVLPPQCLSCGVTVERNGSLCSKCWEAVSFISPPYCALCGFPFEFDQGAGALCAACHQMRPAFDRGRAVMRYDQASRPFLLGFKHGDRTEGAPAYGAWLARAGRELVREAGVIAPVPLHWTRLWTRRFNQSALLAQALGKVAEKAVQPDLLLRQRATPPQGRLSRSQRRQNVAGAFALNPAHADDAAGQSVLLVDDVWTTGATLSACAAALRKAGAARVDVLVMARVLRDGL